MRTDFVPFNYKTDLFSDRTPDLKMSGLEHGGSPGDVNQVTQQNGSNASTITPSWTQQINEREAAFENQRLGGESALESCDNNSISTAYVPNQEHVVANMTKNIITVEQNTNLNPLVALIR